MGSVWDSGEPSAKEEPLGFTFQHEPKVFNQDFRTVGLLYEPGWVQIGEARDRVLLRVATAE